MSIFNQKLTDDNIQELIKFIFKTIKSDEATSLNEEIANLEIKLELLKLLHAHDEAAIDQIKNSKMETIINQINQVH